MNTFFLGIIASFSIVLSDSKDINLIKEWLDTHNYHSYSVKSTNQHGPFGGSIGSRYYVVKGYHDCDETQVWFCFDYDRARARETKDAVFPIPTK